MTWMQTYSGNLFDFDNIESNEIDCVDIAMSLANTCRFNGHTKFFYSVAQHSIILAKYALKHHGVEVARYALLHDAHEAYTGDIIRPVKQMLPDAINNLESRIDELIYRSFGLKYPVDPEIITIIKTWDNMLLKTEQRDVLFECKKQWELVIPELPIKVIHMNRIDAFELFMSFVNELEYPKIPNL